jgi:hypothetical protein
MPTVSNRYPDSLLTAYLSVQWYENDPADRQTYVHQTLELAISLALQGVCDIPPQKPVAT